ncbi:MAG: c-type cytochrome [Anaerolineae bacterium]
MKRAKVLLLCFLLLAATALLAGCQGAGPPTPPPPPLQASLLQQPTVTVAAIARPAPVTPVAPPPLIPHDLEGRDNCLMCHLEGTVGAPILPHDHAGRTNEDCRRCHVAGARPIVVGVALPPPQVPHELKGREDCLMCHKLGVGQAPRYPDDHAGRSSEVCLACHGTLTSAQLSGQEIFANICSRCHGQKGEGGLGPALNSRAFLASYDDAAIRQAIISGRGASPMLSWGELGLLTDGQIDELVALIRSWEAGAPLVAGTSAAERLNAALGDAAEGRELFARLCSGCHGLEGEIEIGGRALRSVETLGNLDDETMGRYIRDGGEAMPSFHALLSTDDINDLLALMRSWQGGPSTTAIAPPQPTVTPTAEIVPAVGVAPRIQHPMEGRSDCLLCHAQGSLSPYPASHRGRRGETCLICHR